MEHLHSTLYDIVNDANLILVAYQEFGLKTESTIIVFINEKLEKLAQALDTLMRTV